MNSRACHVWKRKTFDIEHHLSSTVYFWKSKGAIHMVECTTPWSTYQNGTSLYYLENFIQFTDNIKSETKRRVSHLDHDVFKGVVLIEGTARQAQTSSAKSLMLVPPYGLELLAKILWINLSKAVCLVGSSIHISLKRFPPNFLSVKCGNWRLHWRIKHYTHIGRTLRSVKVGLTWRDFALSLEILLPL